MAQVTIVLRRDPASGKQNIIVKLDSDPDALPVEHEQLHRQLVEKLIGAGIEPEDLGHIVIERENTPEAAPTESTEEPQDKQSIQQGR